MMPKPVNTLDRFITQALEGSPGLPVGELMDRMVLLGAPLYSLRARTAYALRKMVERKTLVRAIKAVDRTNHGWTRPVGVAVYSLPEADQCLTPTAPPPPAPRRRGSPVTTS